MNSKTIYKILGLLIGCALAILLTNQYFSVESNKLENKEEKIIKVHNALNKLICYQNKMITQSNTFNKKDVNLINNYRTQVEKCITNLKKANSGEFKKITALNKQNKNCVVALFDQHKLFVRFIYNDQIKNKTKNNQCNIIQLKNSQVALISKLKSYTTNFITCKNILVRNHLFSKKVICIMVVIVFMFLLSLILKSSSHLNNKQKHYNSINMQIRYN